MVFFLFKWLSLPTFVCLPINCSENIGFIFCCFIEILENEMAVEKSVEIDVFSDKNQQSSKN